MKVNQDKKYFKLFCVIAFIVLVIMIGFNLWAKHELKDYASSNSDAQPIESIKWAIRYLILSVVVNILILVFTGFGLAKQSLYTIDKNFIKYPFNAISTIVLIVLEFINLYTTISPFKEYHELILEATLKIFQMIPK